MHLILAELCAKKPFVTENRIDKYIVVGEKKRGQKRAVRHVEKTGLQFWARVFAIYKKRVPRLLLAY